jgi:hypothetical protein
MTTLTIYRGETQENQVGFQRKPLTKAESKKALDCANGKQPIELCQLDTGSPDDPRQTYCNEKVAKAIGMVLEDRHFDSYIIGRLKLALVEWFKENSSNGRAKLSWEDAESLLVRLYRLERMPVRLGEITPRVMDASEWKAHVAKLEAENLADLEANLEKMKSDCDC